MSAEATALGASVRRVPFTHINNFSALFQDYCSRFEAVASYYSGDYRDAAERVKAVERALAVDRDLSTVADVLLEQNERWASIVATGPAGLSDGVSGAGISARSAAAGSSNSESEAGSSNMESEGGGSNSESEAGGLDEKTRVNIEALRSGEAAAVVTGQQVGVLGGPMYTILKTLTTIQLAEQLSRESGRHVVPIFWIGGEDHDFEEISRVYLLRGNDPAMLEYRDAPEGNPGPVGRIRMSDEIARLVDEVDELLPATDFKPRLMELLRACYRPGATFGDAFAGLLRGLFPNTGLVLMSSDDVRLKRIAASLFQRELSDGGGVAASVEPVSARLRDEYHEQVQVRPANLFLFEDGGRYPIDPEAGRFRLRDHNRVLARDEILALLDAEPERFSPNVVLRPIMQDVLLPTAMYVGGPGEISYFAQYRPAYEWAGIPMPLVYPRASVTIVETKVSKVMAKYGLDVGDFGEDLDRLFQRVVVELMEVDVDALFGRASRHLQEAINEVKPGLKAIDPTLNGAAEAARAALLSEFDKLKAKAIRAEKKNQDIVRRQLEKAQANLFPEGIFQERALSVLHFVNKYSLAFVDELMRVVSTDTTEHQVVEF